MENKPRLLRITTVPISLKLLLQGQLSFFQRQGYEVLSASAGGPEIAALQVEGIPHQVIEMTRKITPFKDISSLVKLVSLMRKFKPSIVHTHTPKAGLLGMMAAWICRVPVRLHTVAGLPLMEAKGLKKELLIATERLTYFFSTGVYVNSVGLKNYISQTISSSKKISIIGKGSSNGIDVNFYKPSQLLETQAQALRAEHGISREDVVFSFVGRIVRDKGIGEAVTAFKRMMKEYPGKRFFFFMVGPFEQDLDPLDASDYEFLKASKNVILPGFQRDVRPWIMASDIFIFPSYREGFPNVVMQACCLGVPSIVSDINGCNEIVKHRETGMIVPPKDGDALFAAMKEMIEDGARRDKYSTASREYVSDNFDQQHIWALLNAAYEKHIQLS